jgi:hypothetical protein
VELEYCPQRLGPDTFCPPYLTLKENYKSPDGRPKADKLAEQWEITAAELHSLAELLPAFRRVPAAATPDVALPYQASLPTTELAIRVEINPGASYPLDSLWRNAWIILLSLTPLLLSAGGLALLALALFDLRPQPDVVRLLTVAAALVLAAVGGAITWFNPEFLSELYLFRFTCSAIGPRSDAWVTPEDPRAVYVAIVPRKYWKTFGWVTDRGYLVPDPEQKRLIFEGIQDRYQIPAVAIRSCEIESLNNGALCAAVVRTWRKEEGVTQEWEILFVTPGRGRSKNRAIIRLARAAELQDRIEALREASL